MANRRNWRSSQYRGSRRSGGGAVLAVLLILALLAVIGFLVWTFLIHTGPEDSQPSDTSLSSEPAQQTTQQPIQELEQEPSPTLPQMPESVRGIYISGPMAGSAAMSSLLSLADEMS